MLLLLIPDPELKYTSRFQNYLFDRYLQTILKTFIVLKLVILLVLLLLNIVNSRNKLRGVRGLDRLSYSNISLSYIRRHQVYLVLTTFAIISICYNIQSKLLDYARLQSSFRQDGYKGLCLLLTSTLVKQLSANTIKRRFRNIYRGVYRVIINRDFSSLRTKLCRRDVLIRKLEAIETTFIIKANYQRKFLQRVEGNNPNDNSISLPPWIKYLYYNNRQSIRLLLSLQLPPITLLGLRVDTIYYLRTEVARHNLEIDQY